MAEFEKSILQLTVKNNKWSTSLSDTIEYQKKLNCFLLDMIKV